MKHAHVTFLLALACIVPAASAAADTTLRKRFVVERTFPAGALAGLDAEAKAQVNTNNASLSVDWIHSYANADQTKTFCVYEGPSADAVRQAAAKNAIPADRITEVPVDLLPGPQPQLATAVPQRRYVVERTFPPGALDGLDDVAKQSVNANNAALGVRWVHSYASADLTKTYCVYEGPSEEAVRGAAAENAIPVDRITEVPVDLTPR